MDVVEGQEHQAATLVRRRNGSRLHLRDRDGQKLAYAYFEEEPRAAISGQAAHPRRGAADCGEHRQAAEAKACLVEHSFVTALVQHHRFTVAATSNFGPH